MKLISKKIPDVGLVLQNVDNGDYIRNATTEFQKLAFGKKLIGLPEIEYYKLTRKNGDVQFLPIRLHSESPKGDEWRSKRSIKPATTIDDQFQYGIRIVLQSSWGGQFPADEIDEFIPYVYKFIRAYYASYAPNLSFEYTYPVTGKKFEYEEKNKDFKIGPVLRDGVE